MMALFDLSVIQTVRISDLHILFVLYALFATRLSLKVVYLLFHTKYISAERPLADTDRELMQV